MRHLKMVLEDEVFERAKVLKERLSMELGTKLSWERFFEKLLELAEKHLDEFSANIRERVAVHESSEQRSEAKIGRRSRALELLREQKVVLLSELRIRSPDKFVKYMKSHPDEVVVIECEKDTAIIEKSFYEEFMAKLETYPINEEEWKKLSEPERKLLRFLRDNALIYIENGRWRIVP